MRGYRYWGMLSLLGAGLALTLAGCGGGGGGGSHSSSPGYDSSYESDAVVTTFAGSGSGFINATGTSAAFKSPKGLAISSDNSYLYVADTSNNAIRKITITSKYVGTVIGYYKTSDPITLSSPEGVVVGSDGYLYVTDTQNFYIRQISTNGASGSTFAGSASPTWNNPTGIVTYSNNFYVADYGRHVVRQISFDGSTVSILAGSIDNAGDTTDASGTDAKFNNPYGITSDEAGNLYVTDYTTSTIRKIVISSGYVTTLAGSSGTTGTTDAVGTSALFNKPKGITYYNHYLYVADTGNNAIRRIYIPTDTSNASYGTVTTVAGVKGSNGAGSTDATGNTAKFSSPTGIVSDGNGVLYVADTGNHRIRIITLNGM
jgi:sugar lactone lactonase YvrE